MHSRLRVRFSLGKFNRINDSPAGSRTLLSSGLRPQPSMIDRDCNQITYHSDRWEGRSLPKTLLI